MNSINSSVTLLCEFVLIQDLTELDVDGNEIGDEGINYLIQVHKILYSFFSFLSACYGTGIDRYEPEI